MGKSVRYLFLILALAAFAPDAKAGAPKEFKSYVLLEKGEWMANASAVHARLNGSNTEILQMVTGLDASGRMSSLAPYISYAYKDNASVGLRLSYSSVSANLAKADLAVGDLLNSSLKDIDVTYGGYGAQLFHRNYFGFEESGTVGLFLECRLGYSFTRLGGGSLKDSPDIHGLRADFCPGVMLYVLPFVSLEACVSLAGVNWIFSAPDDSGVSLNRVGGQIGLDILGCSLGVSYHF